MDTIAHFCQKCRSPNKPGDSNCQECGTRLMIVTLPATQKHDEEIIPPSYYEDHLLERVSLLEFRLKQVSDQLALAYDFITRQSETSEKDHLVIASFLEALGEIDAPVSKDLNERVTTIHKRKIEEFNTESRQKKDLNEIFSDKENPNAELFSHLVKEGIRLLEENEEKQAFRTLERASLLSPKNYQLLLFIAEKLFLSERFDEAKIYLEKAHSLNPHQTKLLIYLSVIYADEFEKEKAQKMLSVLAGSAKTKTCANIVWGMLAGDAGDWKEALVAFGEAESELVSAEIFYLIGCSFFQTLDYGKAQEYLEKAVLMDTEFADAWFMISIICERKNEVSKAQNALQMAFEAKETGAACLDFLRKTDYGDFETALPFLHFSQNGKRLLTNGSLRMTKFLMREIQNAAE